MKFISRVIIILQKYSKFQDMQGLFGTQFHSTKIINHHRFIIFLTGISLVPRYLRCKYILVRYLFLINFTKHFIHHPGYILQFGLLVTVPGDFDPIRFTVSLLSIVAVPSIIIFATVPGLSLGAITEKTEYCNLPVS